MSSKKNKETDVPKPKPDAGELLAKANAELAQVNEMLTIEQDKNSDLIKQLEVENGQNRILKNAYEFLRRNYVTLVGQVDALRKQNAEFDKRRKEAVASKMVLIDSSLSAVSVLLEINKRCDSRRKMYACLFWFVVAINLTMSFVSFAAKKGLF